MTTDISTAVAPVADALTTAAGVQPGKRKVIRGVRKIIKMAELARLPDGKLDTSWNFRELDAYNADRIRPLLEDIRQAREDNIGYNGVRVPIDVMEELDAEGKLKDYRILTGHRRAVCLDIDNIDKVEANVYPPMDDSVAMSIMLDTNREGLTHAELVIAIFHALEKGMSEKQLASQLRNLLGQHYKLTSDQQKQFDKATDKEEWLKNRYKGVIQTHKRAFDCPYVVHDEWLEKARKNRKWPRAEEVKEASEIFRDECKSNPMYNKSEPGPKFLAFWNPLIEAAKKAEEDGLGNAPKSSASKSRKQMDAMYHKLRSPILKIFLSNLMGDPTVTDKDIAEVLEPVQNELEKLSLTGGLKDKIRSLAARMAEARAGLADKAEPAPAPAPAPVEQPAEPEPVAEDGPSISVEVEA